MTTYKFFDGSIDNLERSQTAYATPGDNNQIVVRRAHVNTAEQTLTAATPDIAQAIPLAKNEIVLGVWVRVATVESTSNATFDVGIDAINNKFIEDVVATTANTVASELTLAVPITSNSQHITVVPSNSVDLDTLDVEVCALITKSFNSDGEVPDTDYHYPLS